MSHGKSTYKIKQSTDKLLNSLDALLKRYKESHYISHSSERQLQGLYRFEATFNYLRKQSEMPTEAIILIVYDLAIFDGSNPFLTGFIRHHLEQTIECPLLDALRYKRGVDWTGQMLQMLYMNLDEEMQLQLPKLKTLGIVAGLEQYANHLCQQETSALVGKQLLDTSKEIVNAINSHEQLDRRIFRNIIQQARQPNKDEQIPFPSLYLKALAYLCSAIAYVFNCPINKLSSHKEVHHFFYNANANSELAEIEYIGSHQYAFR